MPWFKVDDTFAMHEKVMAAGNAAVGLWTRAGAWSMQQLTDGFVPDHVLRILGTPKERRTLVEVSLWEEVKGGVRFKNWEERQPTKLQVEAARQAAAERQRHARERAKSQRESRRDSQRSSSVSHGPPDPTRPDPTPPPTEESGARRAHQLPNDFEPNDTNRRIAEERGLDLGAVVAQFSDHHRAKGTTMKDWHLALNTWLRRERAQVPVRSSGWSEPQSLPSCPYEIADDAQAYAAWVRDWNAGLEVVTADGGKARKAS